MDCARSVLITGAGSGIGKGLALYFGRKGHVIISTDLDEAAAKVTAAEIVDAGGQALALAMDVTGGWTVR
jgi:3-hydroxybutyrate dehydrogenase